MERMKTQSLQHNGDSLPVPSTSARDRALLAAERALIMFGCYRKADANDPETYTAAVTAILAEYSAEVIQHVTDPRTGIARKVKWLPSIPEIDAACMEHAQFVMKRDQLIQQGWRLVDGKWIKPEAVA